MTEIYGITGMPLAGKTLLAEILEEKGFSVLDMGDVVRIEMEKRKIDVENTGVLSTQCVMNMAWMRLQSFLHLI